MKTIISILMIINLSSCGMIARKGYGAKKQKTESIETINKWLSNNGFPIQNTLSTSPENYLDFFTSFPQAPLLFDNKTGTFLAIGFSNGKYCPKDVDKSFSSVLPYQLLKEKPDSVLVSEIIIHPAGVPIKDRSRDEKKTSTYKFSLFDIEKKTKTLSGDSIKLSNSNTDYTLILPFALFLGKKIQLQDLKINYHSAIVNRFATINVVFLNLDKQNWWGEEWNKKLNLDF